MTDLDIGISLDPRAPADLRANVRAAEKAGVDAIAVGDSQSMYREAFTSLAVAAMETDLPDLRIVATNPVTRHPSVVASAAATVDELSGGRVGVTYATGDSAVRNIGRPPARTSEVEAAIETTRELLDTGEATWRGEEVRLNWDAPRFPIFMVAEGPRTLATAGRVADGVVIGGGLDPGVIEDGVRRVRAGAEEAGRDPDDIELWGVARTTVRETVEEAREELTTNLAAAAHHVFSAAIDEKGVPAEYRDAVERLVEGYDPTEHNRHDRSHNRELVEELGLTEYLAERFAVAGPPEECARRLADLAETDLDGVLCLLRVPDHGEVIRRLGREVLPRFRG